MGFQIIIGVVTAILLLVEITIYLRWHKRLQGFRYLKQLSFAYWVIALLCQVSLWTYLIFGRGALVQPIEGFLLYYYNVQMAWNYGFILGGLLWGVLSLSGFLITFLMIRLFRALRSFVGQKDYGSETSLSLSTSAQRDEFITRGQLVRQTGQAIVDSIPLVASAAFLSGIFLGSRDMLIQRVPIRIRNLHPDLYGFRIVQISDIHIGSLIHHRYLSMASELIRQTKGDMLVVTGDIIDNNNYFLPVGARFFAGLRASFPSGMYGILGNHDFIDNASGVSQVLGSAGLPILRNRSIQIGRGRGRIQLVGLDYPYFGPGKNSQRGLFAEKFYSKAISPHTVLPSIVLNHHPSDFDFFATQKADLVLAGHTHGGQILFDEEDQESSIGAPFFPYIVGHYHKNGRQLYVNRGLGHWFPLRVNCPPEITILELIG